MRWAANDVGVLDKQISMGNGGKAHNQPEKRLLRSDSYCSPNHRFARGSWRKESIGIRTNNNFKLVFVSGGKDAGRGGGICSKTIDATTATNQILHENIWIDTQRKKPGVIFAVKLDILNVPVGGSKEIREDGEQ